MKTILVLVIGLFSFSALAQKHMVTLSGFDTGDSTDRSVDFQRSHGGSDNDKENNIAFNYAYAVTDMFQIGFQYQSYEATSGGDVVEFGDKYYGAGIFAIANLSNRLTDTPYVRVGYSIGKFQDSDDKLDLDEDGEPDTDYKIEADRGAWNLGVGYRWNIGKIWGMNFTYSPSVDLNFAKFETEVNVLGENTKDTQSITELSLNLVKFDVLF